MRIVQGRMAALWTVQPPPFDGVTDPALTSWARVGFPVASAIGSHMTSPFRRTSGSMSHVMQGLENLHQLCQPFARSVNWPAAVYRRQLQLEHLQEQVRSLQRQVNQRAEVQGAVNLVTRSLLVRPHPVDNSPHGSCLQPPRSEAPTPQLRSQLPVLGHTADSMSVIVSPLSDASGRMSRSRSPKKEPSGTVLRPLPRL